MAQYYRLPSHSQHTYAQHHDNDNDNTILIGPSESIYIFPNPNSVPSSPSQSSIASTHIRTVSSDTLQDSEHWEWSDDSPIDAVSDSPILQFGDFCDQWEQLSRERQRRNLTPTQSSRQALSIRLQPLQDYLYLNPQQPARRRKDSLPHLSISSFHSLSIANASNTTARTPRYLVPPTPHARIHIPLLSFFLPFLAVDDSTIHLLSHTSSHSVLFESDAIMSEPCATDVIHPKKEDSSTLHGLSKFLLESSEERFSYTKLKEGCAVACDPTYTPISPFLLAPPLQHLSGLWGLVYGFVANQVFYKSW
ncbi:hypothetical protein AMATHDRAFT_838 [Amanita thiersii Skay4041]|uniref:Uncharacterized protein n=1 Tax=Amanita thiersii Skay4041 TaxID=703135 RepID=A0A2A9NU37_9AGAR|nr:hypothetical protein AMATHDRAFT_838 [Amanita thiersii Skay4041]